MGRDSSKHEYPDQLYTLFKKLTPYFPDSDMMSSIIAYSVIYALHGFSTKTGSMQERRFEEIKKVYKTIRELIEERNENESYPSLVSEVDAIFEKIQDKDLNGESDLFNKICEERLTRKINRRDYMRRCGNRLWDLIDERGPLRRPIDFLTQDYKGIIEAFRLGK